MKGKARIGVVILAVAFVAVLWTSTVSAETTECTVITSLPSWISTQGIYCLQSNFDTNLASGAAIAIATNNVVIDLNGHKIGNLLAGQANTAIGIYAFQRKNITIKNGTVRGFSRGISLQDNSPYTTSQGHIVEDMRADFNTQYGIWVAGRGNIIRDNQVVSTGRTDIADSSAFGIRVYGPGNRVINNDVYEIKEHGSSNISSATGINAEDCDGTVIDNNRIGNEAFGTGTSWGIFISLSNNVLVTNNKITKMQFGIEFNSSTGAYMNNLLYGTTTPFFGGNAAGSTNFSF